MENSLASESLRASRAFDYQRNQFIFVFLQTFVNQLLLVFLYLKLCSYIKGKYLSGLKIFVCQDAINRGYIRELMRREAKSSTTSLRSYERLDNEILSQSVRSPSRRSLTGLSSRTRSVSPAPFILFSNGKLSYKKFNNIYAKVVTQLETLKVQTETKKNETENLADLRRQLQRADEFSIRFSRNNIYETRRILGDIKKLTAQCPIESLPSADCKILCKKIILAYQAASQSLQTYVNYIKNPSNLEVPDKINELVVLIADLFLSCDHLSLTPSESNIKNDGVRICNELMTILSKKVTLLQELEIKEAEIKKKTKPPLEEPPKSTLSMYMTKVTKSKPEIPKKQRGSCLLGKPRRMKKKDEKAARVTHEIYTQKMNSQKPLGSKIVKFEPGAEIENKQVVKGCVKKTKFTPREVKTRDDDVETMIQTIGDDEIMTARRLTECNGDSARSNKSTIRQLLLEAIDELQHSDKKEQKASLEKLLNSIQNHSRNPNVKVYNFKSKDFDVETEDEEQEAEKPNLDLVALHEKQKALEELLSRERKLNIKFKLIKEKKPDDLSGEILPRGKIPLKIPEDVMDGLNRQRKAFYEYRKNNIMYKKTLTKKPWDLIAKVADHVLLDVVRDVALDFQNDAILRRLYLNELLEVIN